MGINNEGMINRRMLLVKAGSFMKISWRKSREFIIDKSEDDGEDSNNLRQCGKRKKRNLSVRFSDILHEVPSNNNGPMSNDEIENRWYQSGDYSRFKKDTILNSLNYINAKRASKPFDETINCIRGIEEMCILSKMTLKRYASERKHVYKAIREEQARQRKEWDQQQKNKKDNKNTSTLSYPDMEKLRSASVYHSKGGRDRARTRGIEYARYQQRSQGLVARRATSLKNLFSSFRTQAAAAAS